MLGTRAIACPAAKLAGTTTSARPKKQANPATGNFALDKLLGVIRDSVAHRALPAEIRTQYSQATDLHKIYDRRISNKI
jgi:hypothetical protein